MINVSNETGKSKKAVENQMEIMLAKRAGKIIISKNGIELFRMKLNFSANQTK